MSKFTKKCMDRSTSWSTYIVDRAIYWTYLLFSFASLSPIENISIISRRDKEGVASNGRVTKVSAEDTLNTGYKE